MKNLQEILALVVKQDAALRGFDDLDLPEAAKARVQNTLVSFERYLSHEELEILEGWTVGKSIFSSAVASLSEGECCYYVFADGSLYLQSNGDSEVWSEATDFADERILRGSVGPIYGMNAGLLTHLGGRFADALAENAEEVEA